MSRELGVAALSLFVGGVVIVLALVMASMVKGVIVKLDGVTEGTTNTTTWTTAYNATNSLISALALFITLYPLIVIAIGFGVVLAYVMGIFGTSEGGGRGRKR